MKSDQTHLKGDQIHWKDLLIGMFFGIALSFAVMLFYLPTLLLNSGSGVGTAQSRQDQGDAKESDPTSSTIEHKNYVTDKKEWEINTASGESLHYTTIDGWFSLSDQYVDSLASYYNIDVDETNLICIGNNAAQYSSTATINATTLSKLHEMLSIMYAGNTDVNVDDIQYSEAYIYMTTGELPEDVGDSFTIEEKDTIVSNGITYRSFLVGYDTEYYTDDTMTETTVIHTDELMAYSDTEDAVEIVVYMAEWDTDAAVGYLRNFIEGTN